MVETVYYIGGGWSEKSSKEWHDMFKWAQEEEIEKVWLARYGI